MFTENEKVVIKRYLTHRIEQMRHKMQKDVKALTNKEFDRLTAQIVENVKLLKEVEPCVTSCND